MQPKDPIQAVDEHRTGRCCRLCGDLDGADADTVHRLLRLLASPTLEDEMPVVSLSRSSLSILKTGKEAESWKGISSSVAGAISINIARRASPDDLKTIYVHQERQP
mmetsp:Transcript_2474/g.6185  ORF Transcript_2474/g.6185 Transcript_2474/m.6185 type:complete len:107 (-) Transcript_2474:26-346(-)